MLRDCNIDEPFPFSLTGNQAQGVTQKDGTGNAFIDIETTARLPSLACTRDPPVLAAGVREHAERLRPEQAPGRPRLVPLQFRKSFGDCPPVTHFDVRIESEASAAAAFYQWAADVCTGQGAFTVDVTNTSSNAAREQFFAGNVDIGVSSLPPQPGELTGDPRRTR